MRTHHGVGEPLAILGIRALQVQEVQDQLRANGCDAEVLGGEVEELAHSRIPAKAVGLLPERGEVARLLHGFLRVRQGVVDVDEESIFAVDELVLCRHCFILVRKDLSQN